MSRKWTPDERSSKRDKNIRIELLMELATPGVQLFINAIKRCVTTREKKERKKKQNKKTYKYVSARLVRWKRNARAAENESGVMVKIEQGRQPRIIQRA